MTPTLGLANARIRSLLPLAKSSRYVLLSVAALMVVGFALRIYRLNHSSLWMDEVLTILRADPALSWREFFWFRETVPHPVWHHGFLKLWMTLFGYTEFQARFVSVLFGTLSIPATYLLARAVASEWASVFAALVATVSYYLIFYAQELTAYTHWYMMVCLSYFFFLALCWRPSLWHGLGYTLSTLIALHVHFQSVFLITAQFAAAVCLGVTNGGLRGGLRISRRFAVPALVFVLSLAPMAETIRQGATKPNFLQHAPDGAFPFQYFYNFFGDNIVCAALAGVPIAIVIFTRIHRWVASLQQPAPMEGGPNVYSQTTTLIVMLVVGLAVPYIVSVTVKPVLFHRYTMYTLPLYLALLAVGFDILAGRAKRVLFVAAMTSISIWVLFVTKDHYSVKVRFDQPREVAKFIAEKNRELRVETPRYLSNYPPLAGC